MRALTSSPTLRWLLTAFVLSGLPIVLHWFIHDHQINDTHRLPDTLALIFGVSLCNLIAVYARQGPKRSPGQWLGIITLTCVAFFIAFATATASANLSLPFRGIFLATLAITLMVAIALAEGEDLKC